MRLTPAFNWLLILLIPLTFSWKLVAEPPAVHETQGKIARFLANQGFEVTEQSLMDGLPVVRATAGDCDMLVAEASPDGRDVTTTMDRSFVVFRGHVYDEQPTWLTVTQHLFIEFLRKLGIPQAEAPIMVAATRFLWSRATAVGGVMARRLTPLPWTGMMTACRAWSTPLRISDTGSDPRWRAGPD